MDRLIRGEAAAFLEVSRLISGFLAQLRAYDFRDEWDDLIQEVVLAGIEAKRARRLRNPDAIASFLRTATRYKFVDWLRRRRPEPLDEERGEQHADLCWPRGLQGDPGGFEIRNLLGNLPEKQQKAVFLVYVCGNTYEEAAAATGTPLGSLKRLLRDGLAALRAQLTEARTKPDPVPPPNPTPTDGGVGLTPDNLGGRREGQ
jgi:RNA polymerase sigma-70 factor (ECF subfamily)